MSQTLAEIAAALGARLEGDGTLLVAGAAEPAMAGPEHLALAMDPKYAAGLSKGKARAAVLWEGADWAGMGLQAAIFVARPRYAMAGITRALDPGPEIAPGIHPLAVVDPSARIGEGAAIGPFVTIGRAVRIGRGARIAARVSIEAETVIGVDALILSGVWIGPRVVIGDRFICHPNAVIGSDGFSFVTPEKSGAEEIRETLGQRGEIRPQSWTRIHSIGNVEIGDDVEIGATATIDRGTIRATKIGSGTKLDNQVHLGHNVEVGRDCLLCGQTGIAGSARIGDRVVMGGQTGVVDNVFVGDDVIAGAGTKIMSNAPKGRVLLGYPAIKMESQIANWKHIRRLGRMNDQLAELREIVSESRQGAAAKNDESYSDDDEG
ncbi:UDP-3-O-(3-hydroxymyristoyl)glucosamine N-acyltransferase [Defluviimonas sp. WL0002]|uniref:UDP-3-O-(3-hydroxymyristoyl)glucosamine N-acyltransferase n=1 Tax=Albidovulum marisflavi TaxID=2984159 RepID=A0ABT2ZFS3_9RHOB|nr:UDP-3-O-(3-hydroxymyristoyl)glucosamine N-acyltransferase [Defluviimonas sp. WL0002]MCV2869944.1 UDP-3-O-(3-hydroxymyristoyl)glucosamine N-acyltransferase [Defluviimonas sp. WL0002]